MVIRPLYIFVFVYVVFAFYFHYTVMCIKSLNGRYTKSIQNYILSVPHKLNSEGTFETFNLPHYYQHKFGEGRKKRDLSDPQAIHYGVHLNNKKYHLELWPNHDFLSPGLIFESREPNQKVQQRAFRNLEKNHFCHYTGRIRGKPNSKAAISTCDGLAGYIAVDNKRYFIEPVQDHQPNQEGQHLHLVYERDGVDRVGGGRMCGTSDQWENIWKKRFRDQMLKNQDYQCNDKKERRQAGTSSVHRYLETLVVCDKKFLHHHRNSDFELYVLTVMNMVSDYYHDASSGNQMDVVVVRVMYLEKEEEEIDLMINQNAEDTLASFCKWQQKINPKDIKNPNHHDIAVLLTRYDICADNMANCGLMGLAYVASACSGDEPCAINEDGGLVLGIVVAHEMGHVMGCSHDKEGESECAAQDTDESYFVMAPFVHLYTTKWSTCSRAFMTALFENNLGECLNDEPETSIFHFKNTLPGTVYDAEAQCNMDFPNSTVCDLPDVNFCEMLLCRTSPTACMSKEEPPADGTKCGENKWCFRKECIEIGERPEAINGGWGEWSAWSDCSRTCGGGVSTSERDCNNPVPEFRGRYCTGERKRVKICNLHPCPEGSPSFREVQCSEHDTKEFNNRKYTWQAYFKKDEPCVLYCINDDKVFSKLAPRVKDGTPCKPGTMNMCIFGVCKHVGCDGKMDSTAVEDVCGICNGDGTQCKIIDEVYTDVGAIDYKKIATIPSGSRNIRFEELGPSENTLAVSDKTEKKFYLNGGHNEQLDGMVKFGDVEGFYSHPEPGKELLILPGPIKDDIILFIVFYKRENVGYEFKYAEMTPDTGYTPHYQWELLEWNDCSMKCGGGFQTAKFDCIEDKAGKVSDNFCASIKKPEEDGKKCNEQPCKIRWEIGAWSKCYACKNKSGIRIREVECVQESPHVGADDILLEDSACPGPKPASRELCDAHQTCTRDVHNIDNLPDDLMANVWEQTNPAVIVERDVHQDVESLCGQVTTCPPQTTTCCECECTTEKMPTKSPVHERPAQHQPPPLMPVYASPGHHHAIPTTTECPVTQCCCCQCVSKPTTTECPLQVGKIVLDREPAEEIKLLEVPLNATEKVEDLDDISFEKLGDTLGEVVDTGLAKEVKGAQAARILKKLEGETETGTEAETEKTDAYCSD